MNKPDYWFELVWRNPPRTMTRLQWKTVSQWLRLARRKVHDRLGAADFEKFVLDSMLYGTGRIEL